MDMQEFSHYIPKAIGADDMRAIELNCEALGISTSQLMENAGKSVADFIEKKFRNAKEVLLVCGTGNNGGDGFVAARLLARRYTVTVAIVGEKGAVKKEPASASLKRLEKSRSAKIIEGIDSVRMELTKGNNLIIDALFGTGFHGPMRKEVAGIVRKMNASKAEVVSIDLPSGLDSDAGEIGPTVKADYTITFYKMKKGLLKSKSAGKTVVEGIGMPLEAELLAGPGDVKRATRPLDMHWNKYSRGGSVLIVGGSTEFMGAMKMASYAANSALAALRTVSGYVTVAATKEVITAASNLSPVFVIKELNGNAGHDIKVIAATKHDAIVLGPGIPKQGIGMSLLKKIIALEKRKGNAIVIDGAMIGIIAKNKGLISENMILTPHTGEFKALTGLDLKDEALSVRVKEAERFVAKHKCTLLLKGDETVVADGKRLKIIVSKTPALATMGTGDVLCGIIASYAASHRDPFESAVAGAYVHSEAGDALFKEKGEHITATDVIDAIPKIIKEFDKNVS